MLNDVPGTWCLAHSKMAGTSPLATMKEETEEG